MEVILECTLKNSSETIKESIKIENIPFVEEEYVEFLNKFIKLIKENKPEIDKIVNLQIFVSEDD